MPVNLETLEIQFKANTASASQNIKRLGDSAKKLKGGSVKMSADTKEADQKLKKTKQAVESMEDAHITVDADTSKAESSLGKLGNLLKAYGLIQGAKKVFTIAIDLVSTSYNATSTNNRLEMLLPENAQEAIRTYAEEMNKAYGLNETGLISMSTNFAGAFVGMGVEAEKAAQYAERLTASAIDYASALDKTPAEVAEIMMSLMRGNTEVADNIGLFGLTVDKLNKEAEKLKQEGMIPKQMAEGTEKYIALLHEIERNADAQGFTGDWTRTFGEYGNQVTALGEQWKTLKENAGTLLQPAATEIVKALNSILLSVILWTENMGKENPFSETMKGYFGDYEMTDAEIDALVESLTKPTTEIVSTLEGSRKQLGDAYVQYDNALHGFVKLLNNLYASPEPLTDAQKESLFSSWDEVETAGIDGKGGVFDQLKASLTTMFTTISQDVGNEVQIAGVALIDSYFEAMSKEAMERSKQFTSDLHKALEDNTITPEEMQALQGDMSAVNEAVFKNANIASSAAAARYMDSQNFMPSSDSWLAFSNKAFEAASAASGDLGEQYETLEKQMYEIAAWSQYEYNRLGAEEYQKQYNLDRPYSGEELMAQAKAQRTATEMQMEADVINTVAKMGITQMLAGISEEMQNGTLNNKSFVENVMSPVLSQVDFVERAKEMQAKGATLNAETLDFIALYDYLNSLIPEGKTIKDIFVDERELMIGGALGVNMGAQIRYEGLSQSDYLVTDFAKWFSEWNANSPFVNKEGMALKTDNSDVVDAIYDLKGSVDKQKYIVVYPGSSGYSSHMLEQSHADTYNAVNGP